eukprot:gene2193-2511_t
MTGLTSLSISLAVPAAAAARIYLSACLPALQQLKHLDLFLVKRVEDTEAPGYDTFDLRLLGLQDLLPLSLTSLGLSAHIAKNCQTLIGPDIYMKGVHELPLGMLRHLTALTQLTIGSSLLLLPNEAIDKPPAVAGAADPESVTGSSSVAAPCSRSNDDEDDDDDSSHWYITHGKYTHTLWEYDDWEFYQRAEARWEVIWDGTDMDEACRKPPDLACLLSLQLLQLLDLSSTEMPLNELAALTALTSLTEGSQTGIAQQLQVLQLRLKHFDAAQLQQLVGCLKGGALRRLDIIDCSNLTIAAFGAFAELAAASHLETLGLSRYSTVSEMVRLSGLFLKNRAGGVVRIRIH